MRLRIRIGALATHRNPRLAVGPNSSFEGKKVKLSDRGSRKRKSMVIARDTECTALWLHNLMDLICG
ncbi:MAG: hypothetical protein JWN63_56 [Candidatus Acidoferrum typicum]|nr:hypothetical protein [Candidatus Acidoferrum typicum]